MASDTPSSNCIQNDPDPFLLPNKASSNSSVVTIQNDCLASEADQAAPTQAKHVTLLNQTLVPYGQFRDSESLRFLYGLSSRDPVQRTQALDNALRSFDGWLEGYGSPKELVVDLQAADGTNGLSTDMKHMVQEQLPDVMRLSLTCPFSDTRERCLSILDDLQDRGLKIPRRKEKGPSSYITHTEIIPVDTDNDEVQNLFVDAFLHNNRLEHMIQVMGYHPQYLESFLKTQQYLLRGDGPLPYDYRHYIAIMAAGRHQCSYLIKIQTTEFILQGGDERWLRGLEHIPQKLRDLYEINKILAHRPWLLDKDHIEKLTRGAENWSLAELMHAITLLAHFHALASFVYGCGINAEVDQEEGFTFKVPHTDVNGAAIDLPFTHHTPSSSVDGNEGGIEEIMRKMRQLTEDAASAEMTQEELLKRFEKIESQSAELPAATKQPSIQADLLRYVEDADFMYEDFARRGQPNKFPCFRAQDYSWEEQGFSLANRLYTDIGTYLDDKFQVAYDMTYNTMGHCVDVDTSSFRRAIWNYIHSMFGIRHDDYDYNEVNQLMERSLKAYIKTVTCFPERVTQKDYESFMKEFKHSEKVHVNLMLQEAKMQAELLYALRAIMKYMT